ncbi:MAG TPA: DUF2155 domain-containing protein [Alphaproteobacteria bacterium]|nr:DUF2155 domain-containing protein [Alphaproteobacteria bacterium]
MLRRSFIAAAALVAAFVAFPAAALEGSGALMQGLDKVTARISSFEAPIGAEVKFGTLDVVVRRCVKAPPEESPESAAFVEIKELRPEEAPRVLFSGWMFASSPALSALEHPVYDVWVKDCLNAKSDSSSGPR